ncbi:MAG TPA: hypothetical protein VGO48_15655 [Conexibacter sp.]|jgi:hypothetical protein|nr:hypothetical protein [Conexibacter sp.]
MGETGITHAEAALPAGTAAWLAVVPTAVITIVAIVLLGRPLGGALIPSGHARFWADIAGERPEPTEQGRFLISLIAPIVLSALTVLFVRRLRVAPTRSALLARLVELLGLLVLVACFVAQRLQVPQSSRGDTRPVVYFTLPSIAFAVLLAVGLAAVLHSGVVRRRAVDWFAESRARRIGAAGVALVAVTITLLPAINTDGSIDQAYEAVYYHLYFTYDETLAVVNGGSPLGDFATQYSSLWPYLLAAGMGVFGMGVGSFTGMVAALTGVTLMALYDVLRRVTRSSVLALLLFLPLLATCAVRLHGPAVNRFSIVNYFGVMPLRYAGPFLLAWLLARHLDGIRPRRIWPLFLAAGLVVLNNTDFGIPALGATIAALVWARAGARSPGALDLRRASVEAAAGLAGALVLVSVLLLARTGALPDFSLLLRYARLFVVDGFGMLSIQPLFGVDIAIFLTHVAAIGVATVRAIRRDKDVLLTGLLAWSGVFGLGAGSYYVGHSLSELLIDTFPCWALSLTLLTVVTVRSLAATRRWPAPAALACLIGFGLLVTSLAQTPAPWLQLQRISVQLPPAFAQPIGEAFVGQHVRAGEHVLVMALLGHRIAENRGVQDVEPFTGSKSIFTLEQLEESIAALRAAGGRKLFLQPATTYGDYAPVLTASFALRAEGEGMQLWVAR